MTGVIESTAFDKQIKRAKEILKEWGKEVNRLPTPFDDKDGIERFRQEIGLAPKKGGKPTIVMAEDTAIELGHPRDASINIVLWTHNQNLVEDRAIHLYGPDLDKANGSRLPYAQIILLAL